MSALWSKVISLVASIFVDKIFGALTALIARMKREHELKKQADAKLAELKDAKTKEEIDAAAKNTLGL